MRIFRILFFLPFVGLSIVSFGQSKSLDNKVVYDPLFWKEQLKLKPGQFRKIAEINSEFYQVLASVSHDKSNDPSIVKIKVNESLENRSEQIWNTFYPNQRRKWQKIMSENHTRNKI